MDDPGNKDVIFSELPVNAFLSAGTYGFSWFRLHQPVPRREIHGIEDTAI